MRTRLRPLLTVLPAFLATSLALGTLGTAAADPMLRVSVDQRGDFVMIGNVLGHDCGIVLPVPVVGTAPTAATCGTNFQESSPDVFWRSDDATGTAIAELGIAPGQARTTAALSVPVGSTVTHAFLYWAGESTGLGQPSDPEVTFERPDGAGGTVFSQQVIAAAADQRVVTRSFGRYFQSVADVTALVQAHGAGPYRVSGVDLTDLRNRNQSVSFGAWSLVVLYEDLNEAPRNLTIFDGLDYVNNAADADATLTGFNVPASGYTAKLGVIAYEGDRITPGDKLLFGVAPLNDLTDALGNGANPVDDFFNSSRTSFGAPVSVTGDLPQGDGTAGSMSSFDMDIVDITDRVSPGQMEADIRATSDGDAYMLGAFVTSVATIEPLFVNSEKAFLDLNGGTPKPLDEIRYTIAVVNTGNDTAIDVVLVDVLPPQVDFVPGSLEIVSGPGIGPLTDATGDDAGEYDTGAHTVRVRIGDGANATSGGTLQATEEVVVTFLVQIGGTATGQVSNQAMIMAGGQMGAPSQSTPTDGNGPAAGAPPTIFVIDNGMTSGAGGAGGAGGGAQSSTATMSTTGGMGAGGGVGVGGDDGNRIQGGASCSAHTTNDLSAAGMRARWFVLLAAAAVTLRRRSR